MCWSPSLLHPHMSPRIFLRLLYTLCPFPALLCLDLEGQPNRRQRAKPTGKPPAVRANEDGNNPRGERGVSTLPRTGPEVPPDNLCSSQKVPILTCKEETATGHVFHSTLVHQEQLRCTDCASGLGATQKKTNGSNSDVQILMMETDQRYANKGEKKRGKNKGRKRQGGGVGLPPLTRCHPGPGTEGAGVKDAGASSKRKGQHRRRELPKREGRPRREPPQGPAALPPTSPATSHQSPGPPLPLLSICDSLRGSDFWGALPAAPPVSGQRTTDLAE